MRVLIIFLLLMNAFQAPAKPVQVYCFSGLGADERAFARMQLPPGYEARFIAWIRPQGNESLDDYALRLRAQIDTTQPYSFIGLSFGGMIALSLSRSMQPRQVILISSMNRPDKAKGIMPFLVKSGVYHIFPFGWFMVPNKFIYETFGAKDETTKRMLAAILKDTSIPFFRWAIGRMNKWEGMPKPANCFHIHGGADRIIPPEFTQADVIVPGAGHLMIYDHAQEVNQILARELK